LTKNKLFWTEEQTKAEDDDDDEGSEGNAVGEVLSFISHTMGSSHCNHI